MVALIVLTVALFPSIQETGSRSRRLPRIAAARGDAGVRRKCDDANDDRGATSSPSSTSSGGCCCSRSTTRTPQPRRSRGGRTRDGWTDTVVAGDADTSGGWQIPVARFGSRSRERDHVPRGRSRRGNSSADRSTSPTCSPFTRTRSSTCSPAPASDSWLRSRSIPFVEHRPSEPVQSSACSCSIPSRSIPTTRWQRR